MSGEKPSYQVTWREKGKPKSESFPDYMVAEARARALSMQSAGAVYIESRVRYIHARWEKGAQTLAHALPVMHGMSEP